MLTKTCTKCGRELPATSDYFHKQKRLKYGLASECKECKHKYYLKNIEKITEQHRKYREENKEKIAKHFKWYQENNKEKVSEHHKRYYYKNLDKELIRKRIYRKNNKEKLKILYSRYKSKKLQLPHTLTEKQWNETKTYFNNKCAYCGKECVLIQEHFIPVSKGGGYTMDNILPSCRSCNSSKNNRDFEVWYPKFKHYSSKREKIILSYLKHVKQNNQL